MFSIFGSKNKDDTPGAKKAHLPSGSNFYYDEKLKKWVNKSSTGEIQKEKELAPPPVAGAISSHAAQKLASTPAGTPAPTALNSRNPSPMLPSNNGLSRPGKKRGARSKYVDTLNPNVVDEPSLTVQAFTPNFGGQSQPKMLIMVNSINEPTRQPQQPQAPLYANVAEYQGNAALPPKPQMMNNGFNSSASRPPSSMSMHASRPPSSTSVYGNRPPSASSLDRSRQGAPPVDI